MSCKYGEFFFSGILSCSAGLPRCQSWLQTADTWRQSGNLVWIRIRLRSKKQTCLLSKARVSSNSGPSTVETRGSRRQWSRVNIRCSTEAVTCQSGQEQGTHSQNQCKGAQTIGCMGESTWIGVKFEQCEYDRWEGKFRRRGKRWGKLSSPVRLTQL